MTESKPLQGISILDFTRLLPGPLGTHLLAEMGAQITKIESPKRPDYVRSYPPKIEDTSALFYFLNHSKQCLTIDYEQQQGYAEIVELIKKTDVLIEQFRPGTMASFGLGFDEVCKINPKLVYVSLSGYGQTGKNKHKAGHDLNFMALSGLLDLNKDETGKPVIPAFQLADIAGGSYMLLSAVTGGLLAMYRTQKPQYIDLSMADSIVSMAAIAHGMQQGSVSYQKKPILSGYLVNYNVYKTKDNQWVALAALELKFWNSFCDMIHKPEWKNLNESELIAGVFDKNLLETIFREKNRDEWTKLAENYDNCLTPVLSAQEVLNQNDRNRFKKIIVGKSSMFVYAQPFKIFST